MNAPVLTCHFDIPAQRAFADLDLVCVLGPVMTDEGEEVPAGTRGTVVAIYADGAAYEIEFEAGLATVDRMKLQPA